MEATNDGVSIINGDWPHVSQSLDLGSTGVTQVSFERCIALKSPAGQGDDLPFLNLVVRHAEAELTDTRLDGVPAGQPRSEVDIAGKTKIGRVDNLICRRIVENGLGVNASLVSEGAETSNGVVEGDVDLHSLGNQILDLCTHSS